MILHIRRIYLRLLFTLSLSGTLTTIPPTLAQPIVPRLDTNTHVTPNGKTFDIEGGRLSDDGSNLFHTFEQFGLSNGEIANFISNPQIQNILTRINGGNPSIINGLIQVTGGPSNLFLMNPNGIVFGSGASLNVPGSFTATTADRIGFEGSGAVQWFNSKGTNNYSSLLGSPSQFAFTMEEAGAIANSGNLGVGSYQNLTLIGGTVVSTGTLSAPGNLIVAAVPGQSLVRISQIGHLLSLEVDPYLLRTTSTGVSVPGEMPLNPLSLPELLAGDGGTHATGVNLNSDGTVTLTGSGVLVEQGDVSSRHLQAGTAIVFAQGNLTAVESQFETTGNLHLQAGNGVNFEDSSMHPLQVNVGRNLQIRSDRRVTLDLLNHPDSQIQVQGNLNIVSDGNITLDGALQSGVNVNIFNNLSQPTAFQSLNEVALTAGGNVVFGDYTGGSLRVDAAGAIAGGKISVAIANSDRVSEGEVHLNAGIRGTLPTQGNDSMQLSPGSIIVGEIALDRPDMSLVVEATGAIQTGTLSTAGGDITLTSGDLLNPGAISTAGGDITLISERGSIDTSGRTLNASSLSDSTGGTIALTAETQIISGDLITENNLIQINGPLYLRDNVTLRTTGLGEDAGGGNIQGMGTINGNFQLNLEAGTGDVVLKEAIGNEEAIAGLSISAQNIELLSPTTTQGAIAIDSSGIVTLGDRLITTEGTVNIIATDAIVTDNITTSGAEIYLNSQNSQITTGDLQTATEARDGGKISLRSREGLSTGAIDTHSTIGVGGAVTLQTQQNDIQASFINTEGATQGGTVEIQTTGSVRIVDSFLSQTGSEFSISTAAPQGGEITITHGRSEFVIGDADGNGMIENGSLAAITTGSGEFLSLGQSVSQSRIYLNPNLPPASSSSETDSEAETTTDETTTDEEENKSSDDSNESNEAESDPTEATEDDSPTDLGEETPAVDESTAADSDDSDTTPETPVAEPPTPEEPVAVSEPAATPTPEEPVAVSEPAVTPTPTVTPEQPVAVSEPAVTPTPTVTPEQAVAVSEPAVTPTPTVTPEQPVAVSEPVVTPTPGVTPEQPVAVSEPVVTPTPAVTPEQPVAVSEPVVTPTPAVTPEQPVAVSEPEGIDIPGNIPLLENRGSLETIPKPEEVTTLPVVEILPLQPVAVPMILEVPSQLLSVSAPEIPPTPVQVSQSPDPLVAPLPVNMVAPLPVNVELPSPTPPEILLPQPTDQSSSLPLLPPSPLAGNATGENALSGVVEMTSGNLGSRQMPILEVPILEVPMVPSTIVPSPVEVKVPFEGAIASPSEPNPTPVSNLGELEAVAQALIPPIEQIRMQEFDPDQQGPISEDEGGSKDIKALLQGIRKEINVNPAVVYAISLPEELQLVVMTAEGLPIIRTIPTASRDSLRAKVTELLSELTNPHKTHTDSYMSASVQLYEWLIAPIAAELEAQGIDMLMFSLDAGLRGIPLAALHDGKQFLIEKYRLGLIPSVNLTQTSYKNLNQTRVLAMGASHFQDSTVPHLNAVPAELAAISSLFSLDEYFLNEAFTADNLRDSRRQQDFDIIHLATHVKFYAGLEQREVVSSASRRQSYIQFWDEKVPLEQMRQLGFEAGTVELLVLSACETAVGSPEAELGFAGLALQMGVKSVLASLWQVDDEGTLGLMSEFYQQLSLQDKTIKSEALRQAQLAFLRGEVRVSSHQLRTSRGSIDLPPEIAERMGDRTFTHPYFWAAFTLVGSPW